MRKMRQGLAALGFDVTGALLGRGPHIPALSQGQEDKEDMPAQTSGWASLSRGHIPPLSLPGLLLVPSFPSPSCPSQLQGLCIWSWNSWGTGAPARSGVLEGARDPGRAHRCGAWLQSCCLGRSQHVAPPPRHPCRPRGWGCPGAWTLTHTEVRPRPGGPVPSSQECLSWFSVCRWPGGPRI